MLRDKGLNGIGIEGLMKAAGLTRGGFYVHFPSREALVAEAVAYAMAQATSEWQSAAGINALTNAYLRQEHRDNPARGCPLPALSADVARSGSKVRRVFTAALNERLGILASQISKEPSSETRRLAAGVMATMVGSVILARACDDAEMSNALLDGGRDVIRSVAALNKPASQPRDTKNVNRKQRKEGS